MGFPIPISIRISRLIHLLDEALGDKIKASREVLIQDSDAKMNAL